MSIPAALTSCTEYELEIETARRLLYAPTETALPKNVELTIRFCVENGISFLLTRNERALSCHDAHVKRKRSGQVGIPLKDELKSIVFKGRDGESHDKAIIVHCRANMRVDVRSLVANCNLSQKPLIMPRAELCDLLNMEFGIVNPFVSQALMGHRILHVFDSGLLASATAYPSTMMTNAGNHTWGIEFAPNSVVEAIDNKIICDAAIPDGEPEFGILSAREDRKTKCAAS